MITLSRKRKIKCENSSLDRVCWAHVKNHLRSIFYYLQTSSLDVDDKDKMLGKIEVAARTNTKEKVQSMQLDSLH